MKYSLHVLETTREGKPYLFNSVTREGLPADATEQALSEKHFLAGQEHQAIMSHLTRPSQKAAFTIINTWECNLRCTHCTVINKLQKHDPIKIDPVATTNFLKRFIDHYNIPSAMVTFLGGEPLLDPDSILKCIELTREYPIFYNITTNLTLPLTSTVMDVLRELNHIGISLDGDEFSHNEQRRPLAMLDNPYRATFNNIKELVKAGMQNKIGVQSALSDRYYNDVNRRSYLKTLLLLGVPLERIKFGCIHPTDKKPERSEAFDKCLRTTDLKAQVCCKYRYYNLIIDRDGSVFSDYYSWERVGTTSDDMESMDLACRSLMENMPALRDPVCRTCPAIGYCWGGCTNGGQEVRESPSKYCDQAGLIKTMNRLAQEGVLA